MKDTYWFPHDSNARHDPKIVAMISAFGMTGYGCYWFVVETLREQKDYRLDLNKKYIVNALSNDMKMEADEFTAFINCCVECELFSKDDNGFLYCNTLNDRMKRFDSIKQKRMHAANKRWGNVETDEKPIPVIKEETVVSEPKPEKKKKKFNEDHEFFSDIQFNFWWDDYVDLRKKKKQPLTDGAKSLAIQKLIDFSQNDVTKATEILKHVVESGWTGIWLKKDYDNSYNSDKPKQNAPIKIRA